MSVRVCLSLNAMYNGVGALAHNILVLLKRRV